MTLKNRNLDHNQLCHLRDIHIELRYLLYNSKKGIGMSEQTVNVEEYGADSIKVLRGLEACLLYTSPSPRD